MGELARSWARAVKALRGEPAAAADTGAELERLYSDGERWYHTTDHAITVTAVAGELATSCGVEHRDAAILAAAAAAHDAVYDRRPGEDERDSARWARAALLRCSAEQSAADRVGRLIISTERHQRAEDDPADALAVVLWDADLSVLGGDAASYERYRAAVRREFDTVSDEQWRTGRAAVLSDLLGRPFLFGTETGRQRWEAAARDNVGRELASLTG
jgi:predicted metal-dependent HD superfamily phosphohydrolase